MPCRRSTTEAAYVAGCGLASQRREQSCRARSREGNAGHANE